ncbi:MAG: hypothetical protein WCO61_07935 [Alphaproteobacteria bacterium]
MKNQSKLVLAAFSLLAFLFAYLPFSKASEANAIVPWIRMQPSALSFNQCRQAMKHDDNYWWANKKCHAKAIRYGVGAVLEPIKANEDSNARRARGDILSFITQYRPQESLYCEKGGYCWPAKKIMLLGSILTGPLSPEKLGDESDDWQAVGSSCEKILSDRTNIIKFGATDMLKGCH